MHLRSPWSESPIQDVLELVNLQVTQRPQWQKLLHIQAGGEGVALEVRPGEHARLFLRQPSGAREAVQLV